MKESSTVEIKGVVIKKGDIVKIKFRKLEEILLDNKNSVRKSQVIEYYDIDDHMTVFINGTGHFKVERIYPKETGNLTYFEAGYRRLANGECHSDHPSFLNEFTIYDFATGTNWQLNELLIESISVENEVAESHFSENHQLSLMLIDNTLYINGEPLTKADSKILEMFERVMAETAINNALASEDELDSDF